MSYTNDDVAALLQDFIDRQTARDQAEYARLNGTAFGGPNGDGFYPVPVGPGSTLLIPSPARVALNSSKGRVVRKTLSSGQGSTIIINEEDEGAFIPVLGQTATSNITVQLPGGVPAGWACTIMQEGTGGPRVTITVGNNSAGEPGVLKSRGNIFRLTDEGAHASVYCSRRLAGKAQLWLAGDLIQ